MRADDFEANMTWDQAAATERASQRMAGAFQELLAASEAFIAELDSGSDFKAWEIAKDNLRAAVLTAKGQA